MKEKVKLLIENKGKLLLLQPIHKEKFTLIGGTVNANESVIEAGIRESFEEAGLLLEHKDFNTYFVCHTHIKAKSTLFYCFLLRGGNFMFELKEHHKFQGIDWVPINEGLARLKGIEKRVSELFISEHLKFNVNKPTYKKVV